MTFDESRGVAVVVQGLGEVWEWNGTDWRHVPAPVSSAGAQGLAYDSSRGRLVFHKSYPSPAVIEWDGTTSWQTNAVPAPAATFGFTMVFDAARGRTVLFGGFNSAWSNETWEWDGASWRLARPLVSPAPRGGMGMVFDPGMRNFPELWELGPTAEVATLAYGRGCPGTFGLPALSANSLPQLGNAAFALALASLPPLAPCVLGLTDRPGSLAVGGGCSLYLGAQSALRWLVPGMASSAGVANFAVPVPADLRLLGLDVFAQGVAPDRGSVWSGGLVGSGGLQVAFGQ